MGAAFSFQPPALQSWSASALLIRSVSPHISMSQEFGMEAKRATSSGTRQPASPYAHGSIMLSPQLAGWLAGCMGHDDAHDRERRTRQTSSRHRNGPPCLRRYNILILLVLFFQKMSGGLPLHINIKEPRWDQTTFMGRAKHFFTVTDPRNLLLSSKTLEEARRVIEDYRLGKVSPGLTEDQLWQAKYIYDSAFHPDTGEKMILVGRMSAQVPMNMTITGCMLTFYRTTPAVIFWQWVNQSFNAIVNYTNRSGDAPITVNQLGTAYISATTGAVVTALGLKSLTKHLPPIIGRYVPFAAVAAANCINIPLMRQRELKFGIPISDENGNRLGESKNAAQQAITQVVVSRIGMAAPAMAIPPVIMNVLEKRAFLKRYPWLNAPLQVGLVGLCLVFATPLCCALFPQKSSMKMSRLEPELQAQIREKNSGIEVVYFNKGL
uniref:Sideroflexin-1 n=1 Tax=Sphaerodactylus townsendi TaxID=933632 RepID=A0ACB8F9U9_9SAUR